MQALLMAVRHFLSFVSNPFITWNFVCLSFNLILLDLFFLAELLHQFIFLCLFSRKEKLMQKFSNLAKKKETGLLSHEIFELINSRRKATSQVSSLMLNKRTFRPQWDHYQ